MLVGREALLLINNIFSFNNVGEWIQVNISFSFHAKPDGNFSFFFSSPAGAAERTPLLFKSLVCLSRVLFAGGDPHASESALEA